MSDTYKIIRMYRSGRKAKVIERGLTLEEVQTHCRKPETRKEGVWFDGYEKEGK